MLTLLPTASLLFDNTAASREGWALFDCGPDSEGRPQIQLQREDAPEDREPPFASDRDAWAHVVACARAGSALHRATLDAVDGTERMLVKAACGAW